MSKIVSDMSDESAGAPKPLAVLVIGMHRSGTSALSGVLTLLGVPAPAMLHAADQHNERGYFEPQRIIDFHERVFEQIGSPSNDPLPLNYDFLKSPVGPAAVGELAALLDDEFAGRPMCLFKDPRMCRLAPLWTAAVARSGRTSGAILPARHPLEVAGSLKAKAGLPRAYSLFMWLQHVVLGERFTRDVKRSFLCYDELMADWRAVADRISKDLDLTYPRDLMRAGPEIDAFLSSELRHHKSPTNSLRDDDPLDRLCARAWTACQGLAHSPYEPSLMAEMDAIWAEFEQGLGVYGPLVIAFEGTLSDTRAAYSFAEDQARLHADQARRAAEETQRIAAESHKRDQAAQEQIKALLKMRADDRKTLDGVRRQQSEAFEELQRHSLALKDAWRRLEETAAELNGIKSTLTWRVSWPLRARIIRIPLMRSLFYRTVGTAWRIADARARRRKAAAAAALAAQAAAAVAITTPAKRGGTKIFFLSGEAHTPGHLYRIERYAEAARTLGCEVVVSSLPEARSKMGELADTDILFVWRAAWCDDVEAVIGHAAEAGAEVVFDCDDLMVDPELANEQVIDGIRSQSLAEDTIRDLFERMKRTLEFATYCTAPTAPLAQQMRKHFKTAFVLPNGFDSDVLERSRAAVRKRSEAASDGLVRIGYATGSKTHQKDFAQAADAIGQLLRERPDCRLVLFEREGRPILDPAEFAALDGLDDQIEWRQFVSMENLPAENARFDINLAPLEVGNPFCEAKSELKYFEAALVNVPTIASPTQPFAAAIRHGETGFLAKTTGEWLDALRRLAGDADLRRKIAQAALFDVLPKYGPESRVDRFLALIEQVQFKGRRGARAWELELQRRNRPRPNAPFVPEHEIVYEATTGGVARVTVIVPLYNYAQYIEDALESVKAQTLDDIDLVVVEDRSPDNSLEIARAWLEANSSRFNRVRLVQNVKNSGLGFTRNVGFANADTAYVLPLDADNSLRPEAVQTLMATLERTGAAFAYPYIQCFGDNDDVMGLHAFDPARFVYANFIDAMALIRRAAWAEVGGYDHVRFGWEDYEFWCRLVEHGLFGEQVKEILADYRVHGDSMLRQHTDIVGNNNKLVRYLERRHPWLDIIRLKAEPGDLDAEAAPPPGPSSADLATDEGQDERLKTILPLLREPGTGDALVLTADGLKGARSGRVWPMAAGRPVLFDGLGEPRIQPRSLISNPLPDEVMALIEAAPGLVLNLSAGGSETRLPNVIEAEFAVFRHTDVIADAHVLPFADATFDLVVSMNAFEHYHTPNQAAAEIMRVLKPGGRVLVRTAFMQPLHEAPWHFYNSTRHGIERWFEKFETEDLKVSDNFNPIYALTWQMSEAETTLRQSLSDRDAERLLEAPTRELVDLWRDPSKRDGLLWKSFEDLPQEAQESLAAGFQFIGRKPLEPK